MRTALETPRVPARGRPAHRQQLTALHAYVAEKHRAARAGDAVAARRAGAAFHEAVVAAAGNALLSELFATTRGRMLWLLGQHSAPAEMADEHATLARAVGDQDADRAEELALAHLVMSREAALARLC